MSENVKPDPGAPQQAQPGPSNIGPSTSTAPQAQPVAPQLGQAAAAVAAAQAGKGSSDVATVIGQIMAQQFGEGYGLEKIATILKNNMDHFAKQGKLTPAQIHQLQMFADKHENGSGGAKVSASPAQPPHPQGPATPTTGALQVAIQQATGSGQSYGAIKPGDAQTKLISAVNPGDNYPPTNTTLNYTNPGAVTWTPTRPTLTGGLAAGRVSGTPSQVARENVGMLTIDDNTTRRKNTPGDQNMRRTIQDLVSSVDPNVKIEPEVEDLLLNIADEFIDSVTNFACRLAKHRGGDSLEVRDLQLHLERNHNIRVPGFASDETQISLSQTGIGPALPAAAGKKNAQGQHTTLRSQRLAQVQQAKREAKLM
ncbi:hypothetical protein FA13DRAFT_1631295 [Coprinellus micaceus]|uniref:TBP-associated factor 12 n=1 Tax=Coprinellus micaceus TaxID=71717 RepID=A0A4Y7T8Y9_COPMI|nr:hypothetical protein FA13DRAFT_1631295 [Coprinellus micaceus]